MSSSADNCCARRVTGRPRISPGWHTGESHLAGNRPLKFPLYGVQRHVQKLSKWSGWRTGGRPQLASPMRRHRNLSKTRRLNSITYYRPSIASLLRLKTTLVNCPHFPDHDSARLRRSQGRPEAAHPGKDVPKPECGRAEPHRIRLAYAGLSTDRPSRKPRGGLPETPCLSGSAGYWASSGGNGV